MAPQHPRPDVKPTLGRHVVYRGTAYPSPPMSAVIAAAHEPGGLEDQPQLADHLHLVVFDLGGQGGTRAEFDVAEDEHIGGYYTEAEQGPGTWRWPAL
jgi:hypothetical protein